MSKKKKNFAGSPSPVSNNAFRSLADLRDQLPSSVQQSSEDAQPPADSPSLTETWKRAQLVLMREKKGRRGKTVVRITGIKMATDELTKLCREIKHGLGCGAVVYSGDIIVLGDVSDRLVQWFEKRGATRVKRGN